MKVCNNCELPITCTANTITSAWKLINNQDYTAKVEKLNPNSIRVKLESSVFALKITKKPLKATEIWETPFGSHENTVKNNRGVLTLLNKWYKALTEDDGINIVSAMKEKQLIKSTPVIADLCSQCMKDSQPKRKKKSTKKRKTKKKIVVGEGKTTIVVGKKKAAALEDSTLLQLKAIDIEERIAAAKKQKIALKDIIIMYLEDKAQSTEDRQVDEIAKALDAETTQVKEVIKQLVAEKAVQKEFPLFEDYYILTKDHTAEITRKYLEIQYYFKSRADDLYCCTQASVSLEFELPFSIVGVLLNNMTINRLITKEAAEIVKDGTQRKVRYYASTTF